MSDVKREDAVLAFLPPPNPAPYPLYLIRCECHVLSGHFCMCGSSSVCCVIWSSARAVSNSCPFSLAGFLMEPHAVSVPSDTWPHELHSAKSLSSVWPTALSLQLLRKKRKKSFRTMFCFNPGVKGGMDKGVGRD